LNHTYLRRTIADEEGEYRFVVPYSTNTAFSPDVHVRGSYRIESPHKKAFLMVAEEDVIAGGLIHGPDL
jgi:hypothetical protein